MAEMQFFYGGWEPLARIVLMGTGGYATLLVLLRVTGARTLSRMTPFDFVITVTIGSAFGRVLTAQEVSLAEVVVTFLVLVGLQWLVVTLRSSSPRLSHLLTPEPSLLYHEGRFVERMMRRHRLTEDDLLTAAREKGLGSIEEAHAIILEPDGMFAVVTPSQLGDGSALRGIERR